MASMLTYAFVNNCFENDRRVSKSTIIIIFLYFLDMGRYHSVWEVDWQAVGRNGQW